jgi:large subunit ribosomal protein L25
MEKIQLKAETRALEHKANAVRNNGYIPAELYGHNVPNTHLQVNRGDFEKLFRKAGESTIIELMVDGKTHNVLIHDVQRHYLRSDILHVDFYEVSMTEKLTTSVALEFIGEADAVKVHGGTLVKVLDSLEIECLPADLPHNLEVDISSLKTFDDVILASNVPVSKGVTVLTGGEEIVAKVQPPRDVEAELAEPIVEDVSSVGTVEKKEAAEEVVEEVKA